MPPLSRSQTTRTITFLCCQFPCLTLTLAHRPPTPPQKKKVVDSLCTLGPIVDAALVPSAYHVPRAAIAPGGASSRSGSWVRGGGGGVARGGRGGRTRSPSPLPSRTPPPLEGGTSGGGIRTTLVCAAGYGQQGSLAVFSAGLRTEVGLGTRARDGQNLSSVLRQNITGVVGGGLSLIGAPLRQVTSCNAAIRCALSDRLW